MRREIEMLISRTLQLVCVRRQTLWNGMVCLIQVFMSLDNFALYNVTNP